MKAKPNRMPDLTPEVWRTPYLHTSASLVSGNTMQNNISAQSNHIPTVKRYQKLIDDYQVQFLVFDFESDNRLIAFFRTQPEWQVDFENQEAVLFVRMNTP